MSIEGHSGAKETEPTPAERIATINGEISAISAERDSIPDDIRQKYFNRSLAEGMRVIVRERNDLDPSVVKAYENEPLPPLEPEETEGYKKYRTSLDREINLDREKRKAIGALEAEWRAAGLPAIRERLIEIEKQNVRRHLQTDPEYRDRLLEGRMVTESYEGPDKDEYEVLNKIFYQDAPPEMGWPRIIAREELVSGLKKEVEAAIETHGAERDAVRTPVPDLIRSHIVKADLAYQDAELPEELKKQTLEWSNSSESANRYAESIARAGATGGIESVRRLATVIRDSMLSEAARLGIPVTTYGQSSSWARAFLDARMGEGS